MRWDPKQYERFDDARLRPYLELVGRIPRPSSGDGESFRRGAGRPPVIVDVGCGNGSATLTLAELFSRARIIGIDSSDDMLRRAREQDATGRVEWRHALAEDFSPASVDADVVVANALLQWVPTHRDLVVRWLDELPSGGTLAFQVPGNFGAPSHRLLRESAGLPAWADRLEPLLRHEQAVDDAQTYAHLLVGEDTAVDAWETTYIQWLDPAGEIADPVLEWVRGTALRPLLGVLEPQEEAEFVADYAARLRAAYPRTVGGVAFPFRRIFCVATKA